MKLTEVYRTLRANSILSAGKTIIEDPEVVVWDEETASWVELSITAYAREDGVPVIGIRKLEKR
jgi:hypothetical protein